MSVAPTWKFPPTTRNQPLSDPVADEFFTTESVGGLAEALVREAVQNSLDAAIKDPGGSVLVSFDLTGIENPLPAGEATPLLSGLGRHVRGEGTGLRHVPNLGGKMPFIVVEDLNTSGLEGDVVEHDVQDGNEAKHRFFWFWRNTGRSGKSKEDLGRWGLGKTVFPALSRINTFFGASVRASDGTASLMGQCVLKTHRDSAGCTQCAPYGYFGLFGSGDDEFYAVPVEDDGFIGKFCASFRIDRAKAPGLSIVIPYPVEDIGEAGIVLSAARQWFYPILSDRLHIRVRSRGVECELTARNYEQGMMSVAQSLGDDAVRPVLRMFKLAQWGTSMGDDDRVVLSCRSESAPRWQDVAVKEDDQRQLVAAFDRGEPVALRVWLKCQRDGEEPQPSYFDVYLERDESLQRCDDCFVRAGYTISNIHWRAPRAVRCLVVIDHEPLRDLLGDAENPAHTEWQKDSRNFRGKYVNGPSTLDFVRNAVRETVSLLTPAPAGLDESLLADVFSVVESGTNITPDDITPDDGDTSDDVTPPVATSPAPFRVGRVTGGFSVMRNTAYKGSVAAGRIEVAYDVRRGNPFNRYHRLDFDFGEPSIKWEAVGAVITKRSLNQVEFDVTDWAVLAITAVGFDVERDLRISAVRVGGIA